jgi:F0F1-type ATP synthase membrane subunit a
MKRKKDNMFTKKFWLESSERALKTFAQFFLVLGGAQALNVFTMDWQTTLGLAIGGMITSYATSIVSAGITHDGTPSLVREPENES